MMKRYFEILFVAITLSILFLLHITSIFLESPAYDEVFYTEAGHSFLTEHDFRYDPLSPPLARELTALPTLFNKDVIYHPVILYPRLVVVFFSLLLGVFLYIFARKLYGVSSARLALILYVFEPNLLAHGHLATIDLIFTFFYFVTIFLLFHYIHNPSKKLLILLGIAAGCTLASKISAVSFFAVTFLGLFFYILKTNKKARKILFWKQYIKPFLLCILITVITIWATYFFTVEPLLGYRHDPKRPALELAKKNPIVHFALTQPVPLGSFVSTFKTILVFNYTDWYRKDSFILGDYSRNGHPGYYFPLLMLIKTPIFLLLLFFISLWIFRKNLKKDYLVLLALFAILFSVLFTKVALVLRYILPLYPFLILFSARVVSHKKLSNKLKTFIGLLCIFYIMGTLNVFPHYFSYVSDIFGGSKEGYRLVADANYDWGQGLIDLKKYHDQNRGKKLQLAYFGSLPPSKYGIEYERIKDYNLSDKKKTVSIKKGKDIHVIISATSWYLGGYYKDPEWKSRKPNRIIGGSLLVFYQ